MQVNHVVTENQAVWLRMLEGRQYQGASENFDIPEDVIDALVQMGFVRRWRDGSVTITLGGIREVAQH